MDKSEFAALIRLPRQWLDLDLYPDEFFQAQLQLFLEDGGSAQDDTGDGIPGAEHYRNGVYWYWIKRPDECDRALIERLIALDPCELLSRHLLKQLRGA
ncbi:hypothetical protein [Lysobacter sp. cf310]|uniref:hypothetical protein n=1 Tax=Lysobacter sp. cf310 TaxID=1761790 RepID=UPI000AC5C2A8|nr:hypothetical protein [Lysobacter sp. cf310]